MWRCEAATGRPVRRPAPAPAATPDFDHPVVGGRDWRAVGVEGPHPRADGCSTQSRTMRRPIPVRRRVGRTAARIPATRPEVEDGRADGDPVDACEQVLDVVEMDSARDLRGVLTASGSQNVPATHIRGPPSRAGTSVQQRSRLRKSLLDARSCDCVHHTPIKWAAPRAGQARGGATPPCRRSGLCVTPGPPRRARPPRSPPRCRTAAPPFRRPNARPARRHPALAPAVPSSRRSPAGCG